MYLNAVLGAAREPTLGPALGVEADFGEDRRGILRVWVEQVQVREEIGESSRRDGETEISRDDEEGESFVFEIIRYVDI